MGTMRFAFAYRIGAAAGDTSTAGDSLATATGVTATVGDGAGSIA
jgi:hypothetical protein